MSFNDWTILLGVMGLLVNGIGLGFLGVQVSLGRHQADRALKSEETELHLRRKELTLSFLVTTFGQRQTLRDTLPDDFDAAAVAAFIDLVDESDDPSLGRAIEGYLWYFETFALGVATGIYDFDIALYIVGARIKAIAENYRPYIEHRRERTSTKSLHVELETLAQRVDQATKRLAMSSGWASDHPNPSYLAPTSASSSDPVVS